MCRLFGLTTGGPRVRATFWLLDAPDSLRSQSRRMPDGTGLGWFSLGEEPVRDRAPIAAFQDADFNSEARYVASHTFVSHVRYASTGAPDVRNSHPFVMDDRLFAHNGVVRGLDVLGSWLTDAERAMARGQTDSELVFAYITAQIRRHGDTRSGLIAAVGRIAAELPVFALNLLLAESGRLWALRYPGTHELWVLAPELAEPGAARHMSAGREPGRIDVTAHREACAAWIIASERMDDDPDWRLLDPGELLMLDGWQASSHFPFGTPAHPLTTADLSAAESVSQT
ncbi:class II glutamine amidotransferase [Actinomadura madurae]|uniref:class II glutamine amidotransferase n=1 Tax=Actinomadura madurae TaxID=1993 RepID=UPI002026DF23|nr:class II glutamine amidotransferase [Actinomadura madurae]MCP9955872.1 class II glutamine amidotransferase [Actinomadura madurae]MCP9972605.1 class II glutamine amidotransferase [Actinomadura madurae]MCP9985115.1 class II glutamine amidotransferase [Actinomadura madurae]MCQ0003322.1 class II glutamine amidotransferase [Actinomadura madurae]MCQ0021330.1 class II glutamine amidotransferase [Actinomadura madurae]